MVPAISHMGCFCFFLIFHSDISAHEKSNVPFPVKVTVAPEQSTQAGKAFKQLYNQLPDITRCLRANLFLRAFSKSPLGLEEEQRAGPVCKGYWCQQFLSQTLQLQQAILWLPTPLCWSSRQNVHRQKKLRSRTPQSSVSPDVLKARSQGHGSHIIHARQK